MINGKRPSVNIFRKDADTPYPCTYLYILVYEAPTRIYMYTRPSTRRNAREDYKAREIFSADDRHNSTDARFILTHGRALFSSLLFFSLLLLLLPHVYERKGGVGYLHRRMQPVAFAKVARNAFARIETTEFCQHSEKPPAKYDTYVHDNAHLAHTCKKLDVSINAGTSQRGYTFT